MDCLSPEQIGDFVGGWLPEPEADRCRTHIAVCGECDRKVEEYKTEWASSLQLLETVQAQVDPRTYKAFRLSVIERVPAKEVAERLGMSRNAVDGCKFRVLRLLRRAEGPN